VADGTLGNVLAEMWWLVRLRYARLAPLASSIEARSATNLRKSRRLICKALELFCFWGGLRVPKKKAGLDVPTRLLCCE
jgi:hypothetical protein